MTKAKPIEDPQRVDLLPPEQWDPELLALVKRALLTDDEPLNFFHAMAYHPRLVRKWLVFAGQVLGKGILDKRHRELVVLRTVWVTGAMYEFVHHAEIGAENGLSREEIEAIKAGPDAGSWASPERELLLAADELHRDSTISDSTWDALRAHFDAAHLLEIVLLVGQYHLVAFFVRSFGVPLEAHMVDGEDPAAG